MILTITVDGAVVSFPDRDGQNLLDVLRDDIGVTGPKPGCGEDACGACTVLVGRRAVTACTTPAAQLAGQQITTVAGLAEDGVLHPVQQAWLETGAMQCGYCTPGWLTAIAALLARTPDPDDDRIAAELAGSVCRCWTYPRILRAVHRAAELMNHPELLLPVPPPADARGWGARPAGPAPAAPRLPAGLPWDQAPKDGETFFGPLCDGLVAVVSDAAAGAPDGAAFDAARQHSWDAPDGAWVHVSADGTITAFTGKVEAGQGTRTVLALLVAEELAMPPASVRLVMGQTDVSPFDPGTSGDLLTGVRRVERVPAGGPVTRPAEWQPAGHEARAVGGADVVTGAKRFPADLRMDGMLHGCVLRPPAFGATLRSADTTAAAALPGVLVVREEAFIGAAAPDRATARRAIEAVDASWDRRPQPGPGELADYLRAHPIAAEGRSAAFRHEAGDVDAALAAGPLRLAARYTTAHVAHVALEPRSALASWQDKQLTVWTGTSTPFRARRELAAALGIPEAVVHVLVPDFGGRHGSAVALEAARLARAAGRPVKVQWSRPEEFRCGYLRPAALIEVRSSAGRTGAITGWSFCTINSGQAGILSPYRIPHQRIVYQPAESPLPQGPYRA
ncbi:MAG TPA: molybdopterin cofactor-binding domain-containing protein, partial [Streptosporangiaceae bacterium]|nr:molybdopterin cofactor-binding domain-containing protein [Streptosporangiaceae bacterium]